MPRKLPYRECDECGTATRNARFCSRSCSSSYNNRRSPRRKLEGTCVGCGAAVPSSRKRCGDCHESRQPFRFSGATLSDVLNLTGERRSVYNTVRARARTKVRARVVKGTCEVCGYAHHVEVCHIRPIRSFPKEALVDEVINADENLAVLCPNCHWELDNGVLSFPDASSGGPGPMATNH